MSYISIDHPDASTVEEVDGEWVDVDGTRFKLRVPGEGNPYFTRYMVANRKGMDSEETATQYINRALPEILAESLVSDWELKSGEGILPIEQAAEVFAQHPKLAQKVYFAAMGLAVDDAEELEADSEMLSGKPSGGPTTEVKPTD